MGERTNESELKPMEDSKIIQLFFDRNELAISATSEKYGKYCSSIANNILGNTEDAEECVNDTYLKTWQSIPPHKPNVLSVFLGKITRNLAINKMKYNKADKRGNGQATAVLDEIAELVSGDDNVIGEIERKELINAINEFLKTLPSEKKKIFICRYWYFDSVSDIAKQFNMTENNVSVTLNRTRTKLHNYLTERNFEL